MCEESANLTYKKLPPEIVVHLPPSVTRLAQTTGIHVAQNSFNDADDDAAADDDDDTARVVVVAVVC